jgi:hypothetical protein
MFSKTTGAAAFAATVVFSATFSAAVSVAVAATLPAVTDPYQGNYDATSVNTGSNLHTIWLPNLVSDAYWQFTGGAGNFNYTGTTATLTGTIQNNSAASQKLDISMSFEFVGKGAAGVGTGGPKCGGSCTNAAFFDYFSMTSALLTGLDALTGLSLSATLRPADDSIRPQLGWGANDKDADEFGFSTWFFWNVETNTSGVNLLSLSGRGDVNLDLDIPSPVPLPAGGVLLFSALGGLGLMRRRRKLA